jgi:hypothetical protein
MEILKRARLRLVPILVQLWLNFDQTAGDQRRLAWTDVATTNGQHFDTSEKHSSDAYLPDA